MNDPRASSLSLETAIAIIGMAGRFPGARNLEEFWVNLRDGVESISFFSDRELESSGLNPVLPKDPNYVKAGGVLEGADLFDAQFFGFNPREAEIIDPQHRIFLECAWQALESAGYDPEAYKGSIGVYAGAGMNTYLLSNLYSNRSLVESAGGNQIRVGNRVDNLTTRTAYKLNLKGPSFTVQTNCSTSLVTVHLACQSLLNGECDMALAGGVRINTPQKSGYLYQEGGIHSPDGHTRAFDANAKGTVRGNGVGIVVLKRLADATADRDCVHALIKGSAVNNDGSLKVGYTAPSSEGQAGVIAEALAMAGIGPETLTYVETHGTGTDLGDPIEMAALTQTFRTRTEKKGFCAVGSVKTNIGHLDAAAGVAGLIKTVLALEHKLLPPSLHFERPNPKIDFENSPFYVNNKLAEWKAVSGPRRAGVSSFGIGGTNAHVILEEAPPRGNLGNSRPVQLLVLSAKTTSALETMTSNLAEYLEEHPGLNLADAAYTLQIGRRGFSHRRVLVCGDSEQAATALKSLDPKRVFTGFREQKNRPVIFMFPGQGAQYVGMGLELYKLERTFREQVDICSDLLKSHLGLDLRDVLHPDEGYSIKAHQIVKQTSITQAALFVIEYALAMLWMEWGLRPSAMIGHSIGEYVAACLAGVFCLEDALTLVAARGRLMQEMPAGAMLTVALPEDEVRLLLGRSLSLAALNGPSLCVVSGPTEVIEILQNQLTRKEVPCRRLHTSHAFHSEMMEPILGRFSELVGKIPLRPPQIPYLSNVTGSWIKAAEASDPGYWVKHLRQTVRFAEGVRELLKEPDRVLLEVGPGQTLSTFARQQSDEATKRTVFYSLRAPHERYSDAALLLNTLGRLWLAGVEIDWSRFNAGGRRRIPLPTYPFERQRYWIDPSRQGYDAGALHVSLDKKPDVADWFYVPSWERTVRLQRLQQVGKASLKSPWLVFVDTYGIGSQIVKRLGREGQDVFTVTMGNGFAKLSDRAYSVNPRQGNNYETLLHELRSQGKTPGIILHLWSVAPNNDQRLRSESIEGSQDLGFYSLLFLAQALGKQNSADPVQIGIVSNGMQEVTGEEPLCPEKATLLGPCRVIPLEYPHVACRSIDIVLPESGTWQEEMLADQLIAELLVKTPDSVVAYRGNYRWKQTFEAVRLEGACEDAPGLRERGVYLITGGLGGLGLEIAAYLAQTVQAKLVLTGRSAFPKREEWGQWLMRQDKGNVISRKVRKLQDLERMGSEVLAVSADVTDAEQMQEVITRVHKRFGKVHGVVHAAGIAAGGEIQLKTPEIAASVLAPKLRGALVLDAVFKDASLDFLVFCSSRSSILGGFGQVDYCAANAFLDAFAHYDARRPGTFTVSVDWCTWREVGMEVNTGVPLGGEEWRADHFRTGLLPSEGVDVFSRLLRYRVPQVIVSTEDLGARIRQANTFTATGLAEVPEKPRPANPTHSRPELGHAYVAPGNEVERVIVEIWQELFGIEQVGIHDDFFELGGHSLLGLQVISRLRKSFQVRLPLRSLFETPTVAGLAAAVAKAKAESCEAEGVDRLLAELKGLSDEEAQQLLAVEMGEGREGGVKTSLETPVSSGRLESNE